MRGASSRWPLLLWQRLDRLLLLARFLFKCWLDYTRSPGKCQWQMGPATSGPASWDLTRLQYVLQSTAMSQKEELLAQLQADRQLLLDALEGVPDEALAGRAAVGEWSAMDVLAYVTAWDGESLRRIAFAAGESGRRPHDVGDEAYWRAWSQKQVELKRLMGPRGVKVDMASTWTRLLARVEAMSGAELARWAEVDPHFAQRRYDREYAPALRAWRERWERSLPWWRRLRRKWGSARTRG